MIYDMKPSVNKTHSYRPPRARVKWIGHELALERLQA